MPSESENGNLVDRSFLAEYSEDSGIPINLVGPEGGYRLDADYGDGLKSYTLVFDLWLAAGQVREICFVSILLIIDCLFQTAGFGGLIQTDGSVS